MLNAFQGLSKLQKNYVEKFKSIPPYLTCNLQIVLFSMFRFVAVAAANRADTPTSKKYVKVQCNSFWRH